MVGQLFFNGSGRSLRVAIVLIVLVGLGWPTSVGALQQCQLEDKIPMTRPLAADGGPTDIHVRFFLLDLIDIVTVKQEFTVDLFFKASWHDERLGALLRQANVKVCEISLDKIWNPGMLNLNARMAKSELPRVMVVSENGTVTGQQRLIGTFGTHFDLRDFPLDTQVLPVSWISTKYSHDELKIIFDAADSEDFFSETGWIVEGIAAKSSLYDLGFADEQAQTQGLSRFDFEIQVKRQTIYYVWKVFLPLCMIVMVSWAVFWIHPSQLGIQTGIGTGMMLSLIAFLFSLQHILPKINYLTRMDLFVYSSLSFVFLAFVEAILSGNLANEGCERLALRFDLISRFLFPVAFLAVIVWFWQIM